VTGADSERGPSTQGDGQPDPPVEDAVFDRRRAQHLLLVFGRLGATVTEAFHERVEPGFASNVEVMVITSLDLLGPQRPVDILALTGMSSGGVTRVLDRLEERGLMVREFGRVKGDRRGTRLVLTPEGHRIATELAAGLVSRMDEVRRALDELKEVAEH
jgi:DNA-binding MarR family transcriptional regulator